MRLPVAPLLATLRSKRPIRPAMSRNVSSESVQPGPVEASIRQKVSSIAFPAHHNYNNMLLFATAQPTVQAHRLASIKRLCSA